MSILSAVTSRALTSPGWLAPGHVDPDRPFWAAWPQEPLLLLGLSLTVCLYWLGWSRLSRVGSGQAVTTWRAAAFMAGSLAVGVALLSPIAAFSERLFFMHMIQHLLLLLIAPPLLLLGQPLVPILWGLPRRARGIVGQALRPGRPLARIGDALTTPVIAAAAFTVTVAIWHIPVFYDAAQGRTFTHDLEHLLFFGTALLYWWPIIHPSGGRRRLSFGLALPYLLPPFLESMLIGVMLTFASKPFYRTYAEMQMPWGFNPVTDQQLGGLIMWIPGGMFFLIPMIGLLIALLNSEERPARPVSMPQQEHASGGPG
jgi:putative membrane protein